MITITTTELYRVLDTTPASQNIMLVGKHGIGKSEILTHYFEAKGMRVVALFLGQMSDPGDLIGLPNKDPQTGKTQFMPPYWFPIDGQPIVLFLDELNRARPEILQTVMDLCLNRKLAGKSLPEGSRLISAVNDGDEYHLTNLDPALVSRFNIYQFRPSAEEWLLWAEQQQVDSRVMDFISHNPSWLNGNQGETLQMDNGLEKTPDQRAWKKVSDIICSLDKIEETELTLIAGVVGVKASNAFVSFIQHNNLLTGIDILRDFTSVEKKLKKYKLHELATLNESVYRTIESTGVQPDLTKANLPLYVNFLEKTNREAMAHFTSVIEKKLYPKAVSFIANQTPKAYKQLMAFIMSL